MSEHLHNELKKEFQLERMILFSDAVFAIALTLLVIEIKVPVIEKDVTDRALLSEMFHLIFKFSGFLISFFIIGLYWTVHHRMFSYVTDYTPQLIWLNLFFLLSIVLMPFSSGLYGEYAHHIELIVPYTVYVANICFTALMNYRLWKYIGQPSHHVSSPALSPELKKMFLLRSLVVPGVFLFGLLLCSFVSLSLPLAIFGRMSPMLIPVFMAVIRKKFTKKTKHLSPP